MDLKIFRGPKDFGFSKQLLLLDGLDEAQDVLPELLGWLSQWLRDVSGPINGVVMTSRPSGVEQAETREWLAQNEVKYLSLVDLTLAEVEKLAERRLHLPESERQQILKCLKPYEGQDLTRRPLLATMLMHVLRRRLQSGVAVVPSLPEIYEEALQLMIEGLDLEPDSLNELQRQAGSKQVRRVTCGCGEGVTNSWVLWSVQCL